MYTKILSEKCMFILITVHVDTGYGNPTASAGYQGWGPAGPQVQAHWSSTYSTPTQQTGYGSYGTFVVLFSLELDRI